MVVSSLVLWFSCVFGTTKMIAHFKSAIATCLLRLIVMVTRTRYFSRCLQQNGVWRPVSEWHRIFSQQGDVFVTREVVLSSGVLSLESNTVSDADVCGGPVSTASVSVRHDSWYKQSNRLSRRYIPHIWYRAPTLFNDSIPAVPLQPLTRANATNRPYWFTWRPTPRGNRRERIGQRK
jgi:hypothetical protein